MSNEQSKKDFTEEVELARPVIEAMLFASQSPLTIKHITEVLEDISSDVIKTVIYQLKEEYAKKSKGIGLMEISGGYQFRTKPQYKNHISKLSKTKPLRLTQSALETLAIVAYKQPIIKSEIEEIRGVDSGYMLRALLEKKLIRIIGKKDVVGKPLLYSTTKEFLELFSLKDLSSLPSLKNIKELEGGGVDDSQLSLL